MEIYRIDRFNQDGTGIVSKLFFEDKEDADNYRKKHIVHENSPACSVPIPVRVWGKGEHSDDAEERERALNKLTPRERMLLGFGEPKDLLYDDFHGTSLIVQNASGIRCGIAH
jgi:hypothetical protein